MSGPRVLRYAPVIDLALGYLDHDHLPDSVDRFKLRRSSSRAITVRGTHDLVKAREAMTAR